MYQISTFTEEEHIENCRHAFRNEEFLLPKTNVEILSFLSDDTIKVKHLPKIIGGIESLESKITCPEIARKAGVEGIVIIEFTIDSLGKVNNYEIIKGIGAGCGDAVIGNLKFNQKLQPATKNGESVSLLMRIAVNFNLIYAGSKSNFIPRPIYIKNDAIKYRSNFPSFTPPSIKEANSANVPDK